MIKLHVFGNGVCETHRNFRSLNSINNPLTVRLARFRPQIPRPGADPEVDRGSQSLMLCQVNEAGSKPDSALEQLMLFHHRGAAKRSRDVTF